jgi:hypothetical protein
LLRETFIDGFLTSSFVRIERAGLATPLLLTDALFSVKCPLWLEPAWFSVLILQKIVKIGLLREKVRWRIN